MRSHRVQVVDFSRLARMRPKAERREALSVPEAVEDLQVGVQVVAPHRVVRVALGPLLGLRRR